MVLSHISRPMPYQSTESPAPPTLNEASPSFYTTALKRRREEVRDSEELSVGGDSVLEAFQKQLLLFEEQMRKRGEMGI